MVLNIEYNRQTSEKDRLLGSLLKILNADTNFQIINVQLNYKLEDYALH